MSFKKSLKVEIDVFCIEKTRLDLLNSRVAVALRAWRHVCGVHELLYSFYS